MIPRLNRFIYSSPMRFLLAAFVLTLLLLSTAAWGVWDTYYSSTQRVSQISHLQQLSSLIDHGADVQMLAVHLAATTSNLGWEQDYQKLTPQVDAALREVGALHLQPDSQAIVQQIITAHARLMTMDAQVFRWMHEGQITLAGQLLASPPYTAQQQTYHDDSDRLVVVLTSYTDMITQQQRQAALVGVGTVGLTLALFVGLWVAVLRQASRYLVESKRLEAARQTEGALLQLLQTVTTAANEATTVEAAAHIGLEQVCTLMGWPLGHLYLRDEDGGEMLSTPVWYMADPHRFNLFVTTTQDIRVAPPGAMPSLVLASGKPEWRTRPASENANPRIHAAQALGLYSGYAFPLQTGANVVGVLEFFSTELTQPDAALLEAMSQVGTQLGRVVERTRAANALERETRLVQLLQMIAAAANEATSVVEALQVTLEQVCVHYQWSMGHAYVADPNGSGEFVATNLWYCDDPGKFAALIETTRSNRMTVTTSPGDRILGEQKPLWMNDLSGEPEGSRLDQARTDEIKTWFAFPVRMGGEVVVVLEFFSIYARQQDEALLEALAHIGTQLGRVVERTQAEAALHHSEAKTRALIEAVPDAILRIGMDAAVLDYKAASGDALAGLRSITVGGTIYDALPQEVAQQTMHYMWRALQTNTAQIFECAFGEERLRDYEVRVVVGNEEEALILLHDITERKNADRMKNEFISTVSHELRTPLTSIRGSLGLIAGGVTGPIPPQAKALIDIALNNSERLVRLINDILDIEKIESGKMTFEMKPQPLMPLVEAAIEANRAYGTQFGVTLRLVEGLPNATVEVDSDRLTQVLTNLISNAAKFSPLDETVDLTVARVHGRIRVSVTDHGPGISEEFQQRIFQKFAQADSSDTRQKGGTGLGLNIARAIVERLGGSISFQTTADAGTTFYFDLPEWRATLRDAGEDARNPAPQERILICEDDHDIATQLGALVAQGGFASDIATSAAEAKTLLAQNHYAAMTLNMLLPDKNGVSLIRELRGQPHTRDLPIIIVSANTELGRHELNTSTLTVSDWLDKPIDQARLSAAVQRAALTGAGGRPRILHVEDDPDVRQVIGVLLYDMADLVAAPDLRTARRLLAQDHFDLILLDVGLPDGSGLDLLPETGGLIAPYTPVVLFSAQEIGLQTAQNVAAVLLKSRTSNDQFLMTVKSLIRKPSTPILELSTV